MTPPAETLIERVWTLSEGNPFVVVECARGVRDRVAAGDALEIPEQVRSLVVRSFASLGERARVWPTSPPSSAAISRLP
ncbi:MAG: hypothetical protein ACRELZ_21580 [Candidatus Rokuibacteriota bacterium]